MRVQAQGSENEDQVSGCWCCGQECMFCDGTDDCTTVVAPPYNIHWCSMCKYGGCEWCCGCTDCHEKGKGGWSPGGMQVNHDGVRERITREG
jgi:hypothetical protein